MASRRGLDAELEQLLPLVREALMRLGSLEGRAGERDVSRLDLLQLRGEVRRLTEEVRLLRESLEGLAET